MKNTFNTIGMVAVAALLTSSVATAGTVLRFQNGNVNAAEVAQKSIMLSSLNEDYVVQFKGAITEADKTALKAAGLQIFRYIPDDALIVRGTSAQISNFAQNGKVNAFVPFKGAMKLSANLPALSVFSKIQSEVVVISAFSAQDASAILETLRASDSNLLVLDQTGRTLTLRLNLANVADLASYRGVEFVQKAEKIEPLHIDLLDEGSVSTQETPPAGDYSDITGVESGTRVMGFETIWAAGYHGNGQIVAMADTGLDSGNADTIAADFKGAVKGAGYSFGVGAKSWDDPMGHGTHVAGSVMSRGVSSAGKVRGGAYEAMIVPQGMWSPIVDNLTVPPKLNKLFDGAYADGARIHTNSWGAAANFGAYDAMAQQVDEFMWSHPDFLVLYAAGNSGVDKDKDGRIDPNSIGSPGTAKNALTVGASENLTDHGGIQRKISELRSAKDNWPAEPIWSSKMSDNAEGMAMFSSRGPTKDGRLKPEIAAPGTNILSNRSHVPNAEVLWGAYNADYAYSGGTSMATPLVAGAAAVTREVLMKKMGLANPSAALVKATLLHTAHDMYPGQYGEGSAGQELKTRRPNNDEGYGRADMVALTKISSASKFIDASVAQTETYTQKVQVASGKLLANLVYTDAPGTPSAGAALVNNLDLTVTGPNGQTWGSKDQINNNEIVELSGLPAGTYTVSVQGVKVPMGQSGKQPFALVISAE